MKQIIRWAALVAFLIAAVWAMRSPGWDAYAAVASALVVFLGTLVSPRGGSQSQTVADHGIGIQAGRDVHVDKVEKR